MRAFLLFFIILFLASCAAILFFVSCESYKSYVEEIYICEEIKFLLDKVAIIMPLFAMMASFLAIVAVILCRWKTRWILYFWLLGLSSFFLLLANLTWWMPRLQCRYYDKHKPTEFFKIHEGWDYGYRTGKYEVFVMSNHPNDSSLLRKTVEEYNLQTISLDTIKKYKEYERKFFTETRCLNRNHEDVEHYRMKLCYDAFYPKRSLINTYYYHPARGPWEYTYTFGSFFGGDIDSRSVEIEIEDIDLFFEERRKNLSK